MIRGNNKINRIYIYIFIQRVRKRETYLGLRKTLSFCIYIHIQYYRTMYIVYNITIYIYIHTRIALTPKIKFQLLLTTRAGTLDQESTTS